eukprot:TRINITY_DN39884_c0_g1_i3.p1 TRINITY_DN39884_c0_g1~~TRINITY_DN39884_c0_g1_i3.p1  ORF type:complete len:327 (+),score=-4.68 TRINITY_DN39884_c0_g1_i3:90-1070(+)
MRLFGMIACILFAIARTSRADSLEAIERSLMEQYTSIQTLEVKFRVVGPVAGDAPIPQEALDTASHWEWLMSGPKRLISQEAKQYSDSSKFNRIWRSFDGQKGYDVLFWQTDPTRADTITVTSSISPLYKNDARPAAFYGLSLLGREGVLDWLKQRTPGTVRDLGSESVRDHVCQKVEFENVELGGAKGLNLATVWFDRDADWLPRRIEVFPKRWIELSRQMTAGTIPSNPPPSVKIEPGEVMLQQEVAEFMKVDDPLLGRPRWFPSRTAPLGSVSSAPSKPRMSTVVLFDSIKVNSPVDDSRFVPESSPGTLIREKKKGEVKKRK